MGYDAVENGCGAIVTIVILIVLAFVMLVAAAGIH